MPKRKITESHMPKNSFSLDKTSSLEGRQPVPFDFQATHKSHQIYSAPVDVEIPPPSALVNLAFNEGLSWRT